MTQRGYNFIRIRIHDRVIVTVRRHNYFVRLYDLELEDISPDLRPLKPITKKDAKTYILKDERLRNRKLAWVCAADYQDYPRRSRTRAYPPSPRPRQRPVSCVLTTPRPMTPPGLPRVPVREGWATLTSDPVKQMRQGSSTESEYI